MHSFLARFIALAAAIGVPVMCLGVVWLGLGDLGVPLPRWPAWALLALGAAVQVVFAFCRDWIEREAEMDRLGL